MATATGMATATVVMDANRKRKLSTEEMTPFDDYLQEVLWEDKDFVRAVDEIHHNKERNSKKMKTTPAGGSVVDCQSNKASNGNSISVCSSGSHPPAVHLPLLL